MRVLRMFEIAVSGDYGGEPEELVVDLPLEWARQHSRAEVRVTPSELGVDVELVGDGGAHVLGFPWHDDFAELPPAIDGGSWDDIEQGWWASIRVDGDDVYVAETDFDRLVELAQPFAITEHEPGTVRAGGVDIHWNRLPRAVYDGAWAALRGGAA